MMDNTTKMYEMTSLVISTIAPENDLEDSEDKTSVEDPDEMTKADGDDNDRYLFDEDSNMLEYPDEVINNDNVQDEYIRQQRNEESLLDPGNIYPEHDLNTEFEDNLGFFDVPNYEDDLTNDDLKYIQELLQKHPENSKRNEFLEVDKKSLNTVSEEPETVVEEVTQESLVETNSTPKIIENDEETNEILELTSEENSTENVIQDKEEDHEWVWPQNLYVSS